MKKFISMVMAAAMVVSLVPATAFAANTATAKVVSAEEWTKDYAKTNSDRLGNNGALNARANVDAQLQISITDVNTKTATGETFEIDLEFDNAEFVAAMPQGYDLTARGVADVIRHKDNVATPQGAALTITNDKAVAVEDTTMTIVITETSTNLAKGDVIVIDLADLGLKMTGTSEGTAATVAMVGGDFGTSDEMAFVSVLGAGLKVDVAGKNEEVAVEEIVRLKDITVESKVGNFQASDEIKVKVSKGFEITATGTVAGASIVDVEDNSFKVTGVSGTDEFVIVGMTVEAVSAKPGDICTITVTSPDYDSASDEAAVVIDDVIIMEVEEDEDVPVFYSGVDANDTGLTSDDDHEALEVTIRESAEEVWSAVGSWSLSLPEGVYVVDVEGTDEQDVDWLKFVGSDDLEGAFAKAYDDGEFEFFDFGRRALKDVNDNNGDPMEFSFVLTLVAEPGFEGDVVLTMEGDDIEDKMEVVIAKFVAPYTVEAAQNDLIIDYRNTKVPTNVVVKEAEAGLWSDTATAAVFGFSVDYMDFEDDATLAVNEDESGMEIDDINTAMGFVVDEESDDAAAVVTLSNIELYMNRMLAAGAYDLDLFTSMSAELDDQVVFGTTDTVAEVYNDGDALGHTVKEGWINIITAGRDQDDASFTKKVVVPVGELYIIAGEETVTLDVPAYISAEGYTMLPVRAVATALGISNENVLWNQATKQVTILYGQRIITMTVGSKTITVNGSSIPASASVEIVNGRAFLPMRDLATALGVTDITWDQATKTATLNGNK